VIGEPNRFYHDSEKAMTPKKQREIVIEFEKVQCIRKRAKVHVSHCGECGGDADFVGLTAASSLFGIEMDDLFSFVRVNRCHFQAGKAHDHLICLTALIKAIRSKQQNSRLKLLGG